MTFGRHCSQMAVKSVSIWASRWGSEASESVRQMPAGNLQEGKLPMLAVRETNPSMLIDPSAIAAWVYPVTAVLVGEPGELPDFDPERFVYRLDSRSE